MTVYPEGPVPFVAPAVDRSHDLFVLVPASDVPARAPVPLERHAADGSVVWMAQISDLMTGYLAPDRDGSVLVSSVVVETGWLASMVRVSADGGSQTIAYTAPLWTLDGAPGAFGRLETGGGALAFAASAPTRFRHLEFVPASGAPVIDLMVDERGDLRAVVDWVVTPDGAWIVDAAPTEGATVNGTALPKKESLIIIESSGSVGAVPVPPGVTGRGLEVGADGGVLFLGIAGGTGTARLVLGSVDPDGQLVGLRALAGSERDPVDFIGSSIALGARGDAAVVDLVGADVASGVCHSRAVIFPAGGGAAVTRDLGRGYCVGMIEVTSDGALAVSGRFDRPVRFGPAAEEVAERGQNFVTVVDPRD